MIISRSNHVAANGIVSLFLMAELYSIEYYIYIYIFFFFSKMFCANLVSEAIWEMLLDSNVLYMEKSEKNV